MGMTVTLAELCAYLGYASPEEVSAYIEAGTLPSPRGWFGVLDPGARWDKAQVDQALDDARDGSQTAPD
jgi:hypothetical protein